MVPKLHFLTLDVFTSTRFLGNPLAIVKVPSGTSLSQHQKQSIAREFNLSETVFLHGSEHQDKEIYIMDIFMVDAELPFAGHPTVGTGWYLFSTGGDINGIVTLRTKAGDIPVSRLPTGGVRLRVPTNFKIHPSISISDTIKAFQPNLTNVDYTNGLSGLEPIVSIVKGMTFVLLSVKSEEALSKMRNIPQRLTVPNLGDWASFVGLYIFFEREDGVVRTRMLEGSLEDPATGSAASTLSGWLAQQRGTGVHHFNIVQGVEMGRRSEITVEVKVGDSGSIEEILLGGNAVEVSEGSIAIPEE